MSYFLPLKHKSLSELERKAKHFNIFPIMLPHYLPEHSQHPIATIFGNLIDEATEYLALMTPNEVTALLARLPPGTRMMIGQDVETDTPERIRRIATYCIVAELQLSYFSFKDVVDYSVSTSTVLELYPELEKKFDKDGLLYIDQEFQLLDGGIVYRNHILHYHQFLRRNYTSNPNFDFIGPFIDYYQQTCRFNTFRVAIDHRRIMPKEVYRQIMELDTWFGATFDQEKLDDPQAVGLTIVKRNKDSLFDLANRLDRTEFLWSHRGGIKTLQIEEISDPDYLFEHFNLNRYIHSERDVGRGSLRHFDGAVKVYLSDSYRRRFDSQLPRQPRCHRKVKLFRIDGDVDIDTWIELICFFYKSNEMIIEYFDPEQFGTVFEERVRDFNVWQKRQSSD